MQRDAAKRILQRLLSEYGPSLGISYALLYDPGNAASYILVLKFRDCLTREYAFESRMDFATLLPPIRVDIYEAHDLPKDLLRHVFRYGELLYVNDYEEYVRDLEKCFCRHDSDDGPSGWRQEELMRFC